MFWFILGREPILSAAEIAAVLNTDKLIRRDNILFCPEKIDPAILINTLGGTIKIGREIGTELKEDELIKTMAAELKTVPGKINFGISFYGVGENSIEKWGKEIKKTLKEQGYSVRYVFKREATLSSVTVAKNGLDKRGAEFLVTSPKPGVFALARTAVVQPFEQWGARDFGRPGRDDLSGMLPPKLARMLVNLSQAKKTAKILDPFCGSGTIISEALLLKYIHITGSDISPKAISDTQTNLEWLKQHANLGDFDCQIFQADIKDLPQKITPHSIDAIITEPYLGKPLRGSENEKILIAQTKELETLYLEAFQKFAQLVKPGGMVIFIVPCFRQGNGWIRINLTEKIKNIGFAQMPFYPNETNLLYWRPGQKLGREIWKFVKK